MCILREDLHINTYCHEWQALLFRHETVFYCKAKHTILVCMEAFCGIKMLNAMFYRLSCKGSAWKTHNIQILTPSVHAFVRSRSLGTCSRMVPSTSPSQPPSSVNEGNGVSSPCPCAMFLPFYRSISNELG